MRETKVGRSRRPESSGFDRASGLCGRFPGGDLYCVREIRVRHLCPRKLVLFSHKCSGKPEMP